MKLTYDHFSAIVVIHDELSKEKFTEMAGAREGYARSMFSRMYDAIHSELVNVQEEYENYYKPEYENLGAFLYWKYNITSEDVAEILKLKEENSHFVVFQKQEFTYRDYGIETFAFSTPMYDRVTNMLLLKPIQE